jgi:hypothetical protein
LSFYRTGTIALTNGSAVVTGTGTDFISGAAIGECVQAPDGTLYEILSIQSATGLTLGSVYLGATASGQSYAIVPTQSYIRDLASQAAALVNGYVAVQTNALRKDAADKATPVDADSVGLRDSVTGLGRMLTWANIKAALKTYFDSVATTLTNKTLTAPVISGGTINAAPIGGTTPAAGAFTTLSATGQVTSYDGTNMSRGAVGIYSSLNAASRNWRFRTDDLAFGDMSLQYGASLNAAPSVRLLNFSSTGLAVTGALSATEDVRIINGARYGYMSTSEVAGHLTFNSFDGITAKGFKFKGYGTELMTLDASGNLGLGVVPSAWYTTLKAEQIGQQGSLAYDAGNGNLLVGKNFYKSTASVYNYVANDFASIVIQGAGTHSWHTAPSGTAGNPITFTQAMTLDASGNLLVGTATASGALTGGYNVIYNSGSTYLNTGHVSGTTSGTVYSQFVYNAGSIGSVTQSGTTAVAYNTTSDRRLKTNIRPADAARFMDIAFVDFEWIDGRHDCGVIADQLQSVYPDLVLGTKDATEVRTVEITPAVPAVTEQVLVSPAVEAVLDEDGNVTQAAVEAVYETVEVTPAIPAVTEAQTFPVYQQVNYPGLIGRMGTRVQQLQRTVDSQAALIATMEARLTALEQA